MASGTINLSSTKSTLKGKIEWSSSSNGSAANTSNVYATLYIARTDSYSTKGTWGFGFQVGNDSSYSSWYGSVSSDWVAVASISTVVSHASSGQGQCNISGYVNGPSGTSMAGYGVSGSQTVTLDTIPRYAYITDFKVSKSLLEGLDVTWSADSWIDYVRYSINGSNWIDTAGYTFRVTGLTPNTTYSLRIAVRRGDSGLWTESGTIYGKTLDYGKITSVSNIIYGNSFELVKTNPSSTHNTVRIYCNNSLIKTIDDTTDKMTISLTESEWNLAYKLLGKSNTSTFKVSLETEGNRTYNNSTTKTATLTGDIKTFLFSPDGTNHYKSKVWIKKNGVIRKAVVWVNGTNDVKRGAF